MSKFSMLSYLNALLIVSLSFVSSMSTPNLEFEQILTVPIEKTVTMQNQFVPPTVLEQVDLTIAETAQKTEAPKAIVFSEPLAMGSEYEESEIKSITPHRSFEFEEHEPSKLQSLVPSSKTKKEVPLSNPSKQKEINKNRRKAHRARMASEFQKGNTPYVVPVNHKNF